MSEKKTIRFLWFCIYVLIGIISGNSIFNKNWETLILAITLIGVCFACELISAEEMDK